MSVDAATVKRIGRLARIRIEEGEVAKYQDELNAILGFVEQLGEVNVDGVEPMTSVTPMRLRRREDKVTDGGYPEKIVAN
jgi:aspartyl-tRNA(Asn)/glutamyl-tRNA(Gln) amidotransferase subunit C